MSKPRISYIDPKAVADPAMIAEFERCAREGTPRPESQAIRAHVPATFWSFANTWRDVFKNGVADHNIKELCRIYVSRSVLCEFCGNQRSIKAAKAGLKEDDYSELINFESSPRYDERQKAALAYAEAITWDLPTDDAFWARLHKNFSEPELVEIGYFVAITMGQQRWLRTLNIEHHQILAGTDGSMAPGFETAEALATLEAGRRLLGQDQQQTNDTGRRVTSQPTAVSAIRPSASQGACRRATHSRQEPGQALRHARSVPRHQFRCGRTRDRRHGRAVRLRQDHAAALHRRPAAARCRRNLGRPRARRRADRRRRHGVPAFRLVPVEDGVRQRRLWLAHGRRAEGGGRAQGAGVHQAGRASAVSRPRSPIRCPAACSSAAGWRARSPSNRTCC